MILVASHLAIDLPLFPSIHTVPGNKKLTFHFDDHFYVYMYMLCFVIVPYSTCTYASIVDTFTHLIGRRDRTAIIAHSLPRGRSYLSVVSGGEAQWTLRGTCWCSRHRKTILLCLAPGQVRFTQETWAVTSMKAICLASNEGRKTGSWSGLAILQANTRLHDLS